MSVQTVWDCTVCISWDVLRGIGRTLWESNIYIKINCAYLQYFILISGKLDRQQRHWNVENKIKLQLNKISFWYTVYLPDTTGTVCNSVQKCRAVTTTCLG
jgi:hypothetical protein